MKKIIDGKRFDTDTAEFIDSYSFGRGTFQYFSEDLYRTVKGAWFLAGEGGARSKYAVALSHSEWRGGEGITPLSEDEALAWCEVHSSAEVILEHFAHRVEVA